MFSKGNNVYDMNTYRNRGKIVTDVYFFENQIEKYLSDTLGYSVNSIEGKCLELYVWGEDLDDKMSALSIFAKSKGWNLIDWKYDTTDLGEVYFSAEEDSAIVNLVYEGFSKEIDIAV